MAGNPGPKDDIMENMFPKETYAQRRRILCERMQGGGLILLPGNGEAPKNYPDNAYHHRQDSNFLYYFGLELPDLAGVLDIDSGEDFLYGNDYTIDDIIWMGPQPSVKELGERSGIGPENVFPLSKIEEKLRQAVRQGRPVHFLRPYRAENTLKIHRWLGIKPEAVNERVSVELIIAVVSMRDIKSAEEIAQLEDAMEIGYEMHTLAMKMCRPGVTEREIAGAIEGVTLQYGKGVSFHSIVSQHGETMHNHNHDGILEAGRLLLVDAGAENLMHYCSDHTRTFPVSGKFTQQQKEIYDIVLAANEKMMVTARPGVRQPDLQRECYKVIAEGLVSVGLMKGDPDDIMDAKAYYLFLPHGLTHAIGLDVHDMEDIGDKYIDAALMPEFRAKYGVNNSRTTRIMQPGMVVSDEPGVYFIPALIEQWRSEGKFREFINYDRVESYMNFGGIRIEDDLLITETGCRMLGRRRISVTAGEIEEFMKGNRL